MGSSPRMRGTPLVVWGDSCDEGIIPAYAGNTPRAAWTPRSCRDHPRVCGEHIIILQILTVIRGSSPRMRGTQILRKHDHIGRGIIPAYAGNTDWTVYDPVRHGDHPRVCGEHPSYMSQGRYEVGSSPRMRGTQRAITLVGHCGGIIPAYAGNTSASPCRPNSVRDHPRVCGEH